MNKFYSDQNYIYPELCIVKEEFNISEPGIVKCYIPVLMPFIKEDKPKKTKLRVSNSHLDNEDKEGIEPSGDSFISNYIDIHLPNHITDVTRDIDIVPEYGKRLFDFPDEIYPEGEIPEDEEEDDYEEDEENSTEEEEEFEEEDDEYDSDSIKKSVLGEDKDIEDTDEDGGGEEIDVEGEIEDPKVEEDEFIFKFTPNMFKPMFPLLRRLRIRKRYFFPLSRYDKKRRILYSKKDQRFIIVFIGGDINNIKIIGRYDECQRHERTLSPTYLPSDAPWISRIINHQ